MKINELKRLLNLNIDMINIFTDYSYSLDRYFKNEENIEKHKELYEEYIILSQNINNLKGKYKL